MMKTGEIISGTVTFDLEWTWLIAREDFASFTLRGYLRYIAYAKRFFVTSPCDVTH
jgi:hypothetical protein